MKKFIYILFFVVIAWNTKSITQNFKVSSPSKYRLKVNVKIIGAGYYLVTSYSTRNKLVLDSVPVLFSDIIIRNLRSDSIPILFFNTSYFENFIFKPSSIITLGFCCDKNSIEKVDLDKNHSIVFHTMIKRFGHFDNWHFNSFRLGFVTMDFTEYSSVNFCNEIYDKRKTGKDVYWSNSVNMDTLVPLMKYSPKYNYGWSILDSNYKVIYTTKPNER